MKTPQFIQRYSRGERINHWIVAFSFIFLAITGLGFYFPSFFWLTYLSGTPQLARMIHPLIGVVMFVSFAVLFVRWWHHNLLEKDDWSWFKGIWKVIRNQEVGDVGKYNPGQKALFWVMTACMLTLLATGIIAWRPYFAVYFPIPVIRLALLLHSIAGLGLIIGIMVHIYAGIWIHVAVGGMLTGIVSRAWAKKNHPRWYRQVMKKSGFSEDSPE